MDKETYDKAEKIMKENAELNWLLKTANEMCKEKDHGIKIVSYKSEMAINESLLSNMIKTCIYNIIANKIDNNEIKFKNL